MNSEMDVVATYTAEAPVNIAAIFSGLGVDYREQSITSGESGWIERDGDRYRVVVNADEPEQRKRFTAAHELAHFLLHRDLMDHGSRMNRHTDRLFEGRGVGGDTLFRPQHETQANRLAAEIVMPSRLVQQKFRAGMSSADLARDFRVSKAAMDIRLSNLGLI